MTNTYLSEAQTKLPGIQKAKSLAVLLRSKGYIQSLAPDGVSKDKYEFYPYRIVVYHPRVEQEVIEFLEKPDLKFTVIHE